MHKQDTFRLRDGRTLASAEYGASRGHPVFFFQGAPGSRLFHHPDLSIAQRLDVRVITIDRPGFGLSDHQPDLQLLDWPDDVSQLADALGLERFAVGGISAGGPHVLACAYKIPQRLTAAGIVSGSGPTDYSGAAKGLSHQRQIGLWVIRHLSWLSRPLVKLFLNPQRDPERYFQDILQSSTQSDKTILSRPEVREMAIANYTEATRRGLDGFIRELQIFSMPWGFELQQIGIPVHLWHGEADRSIPVAMARRIAQAIPTCHPTFYADEGHFLLFDRWAQILGTLVSR